MFVTRKCIALSTVILVFLSGCIYVILLHTQESKKSNVQRPHIIVVIADDLGWNDVSYHGADQIPTPNIDALAYNGVILQRHYVLPTCTPSRTAFLTGRYPIRTGMQGYPLKAGEPRAIPLENTLLPQYLRNLGYDTHLVGKWHVGYYTNQHTPTFRGFDTFFGYYNGYVQYFNHTVLQDNHTGYDLHYNIGEKTRVEYNYEYMTDLLSERAENIIASHNPTKPLYLQLAHLAPHSSDAKNMMEVRDVKEMNSTLSHIENMNRRKFGSVVMAMDQSVGRIVAALKNANMLENSIIVFMSDNGAQSEGFLQNFGSNYPLRGLKFTLFEGGIRGVACIYSPLIEKPSRVSSQLFHITDWLPTLYSAAGGNPEDIQDLDGMDQWSVIKSAKKTNRKSILLNIDEVSDLSGALIGRYKLVKGAIPLYGDYYGDNGSKNSYPVYDIANVLESPAGIAISNITRNVLNSRLIRQLRRKSKVLCNSTKDYPKCEKQCLFDVYKDPCETKDLSAWYPQIAQELNVLIEDYRTVLMNQTNRPVDHASFPENFNGTWLPWIKNDNLNIKPYT